MSSTNPVNTLQITALDLESAQFSAVLTRRDPTTQQTRELATIDNIDQLNEPIRSLLADDLKRWGYSDQDDSLAQLARNPLHPPSLQRAFERAAVINRGEDFAMNLGDSGRYGYSINLDERGEFHADVRDLADHSVFHIVSIDDLQSSVEMGLLRHKDDYQGLERHLREVGIIGDNADIVALCDFEDHQHHIIDQGEALFDLSQIRDGLYELADYVENSYVSVGVHQGLPSVTIEDIHDPENAIHLQEHEAETFLEQARQLSEEAVVPIEDAYKAAAKSYVEAIEPSQGPSPG